MEMNAAKSAQYLGVSSHDLTRFADPKAVAPLSQRELSKVRSLRRRAEAMGRSHELQELLFMENTRQKAEIESLYFPCPESFLFNYLISKLQEALQAHGRR
jgi:DNA topoisomerase VI subunit A